MPNKRKYNWKQYFRIIKELGEGGNAHVFLVQKNGYPEQIALKQLEVKSKEKKQRFIDEIKIIKQNQDVIAGIIPVIESSSEEFWYTMPQATSILRYIKETKASPENIITGIMQLAETLIQLHEKGISHRDIKPDNLYYYNGRYCLGDFGLVSFPDNKNGLTKTDKGLGAIFTIAPEMKRNPKESDGKKADVFSLSKTLWMLLTSNTHGFDGVYNPFDRSHGLRFFPNLSDIHLVELENLLTVSTDNDPNHRPDMVSFLAQLKYWLDIITDDMRAQTSEWNFINHYLFRDNTPEFVAWNHRESIINVLNAVGTLRAFNHMLFPDGGGLDFKIVEAADEEGCICITDTIGFHFIVKPLRLHMEVFKDDYIWSYFLLELSKLDPIFEKDITETRHSEALVEDFPGHYVSARDSVYGVYDYDEGQSLPSNARNVERYWSGNFLIVLKGSPYNGIVGTYDGRHNQCDSVTFHKYMMSLKSVYHKLISRGIPESSILHCSAFNRNPFIPDSDKSKSNLIKTAPRSPKDYVAAAYQSWNFCDLLNHTPPKNIAFYFSFYQSNGGSIFDILQDRSYYLCMDGTLKITPAEDDIFYTHSRKNALLIRGQCESRIAEFCIQEGWDRPGLDDAHFMIHLKRIGKPIHLFTKQEIEDLMRNADDRHQNMLVIDENGFAKIIQDIDQGHLYPVRHESWNSRNNYVGRYSSLSTLDDTYLGSLQQWLNYLAFGSHAYVDYIHQENTDIDALIQSIRKYY